MNPFDFAIVGAGIAGASLAARLAGSARVLLLEREEQPGYHSTGRSAALYSALYGNEPVRALTRASRRFFDAPPKGFAEHPLLVPRGVIYCGSEDDAAAVTQLCGSPLAAPISTAQALQRVPILRAGAAACAAFEAGAFDIDVHALHQGFLRQARSAGAKLVTRAGVTAIEHGRDWRLYTTAGEFEARVLVNAAGAWADRLAQLAGVRELGLRPLRRTAILLKPPAGADSARWPAVIAAGESFYFKPDAGLLLASPADETPSEPCDAQPDDLDVAVCVERIEAATTLTVDRVGRRWAGLRTFASDRTPVAGFDARDETFFWLAGQGGYGVQTAPALSELAAALALRRPLPRALADEGLTAAALAPQRLGRNVQYTAA